MSSESQEFQDVPGHVQEYFGICGIYGRGQSDLGIIGTQILEFLGS